ASKVRGVGRQFRSAGKGRPRSVLSEGESTPRPTLRNRRGNGRCCQSQISAGAPDQSANGGLVQVLCARRKVEIECHFREFLATGILIGIAHDNSDASPSIFLLERGFLAR